MNHGVQAGFCGNAIGGETLHALKNKRFDLIRVDLQPIVELPSRARGLVLEVFWAGLRPLLIIRADHLGWLDPLGCVLDLELLNEPDLNGPSAAEYAALVDRCLAAAPQHRYWVGAVSNLNRRGLDYLAALPWTKWSTSVGCSVHWYPHGHSPEKAHPGFSSRAEEVSALRSIIGDRPWGVSEFGYHTAWRRSWGIFPWRLTDAIISGYARIEWAFWQHQGAAFAVWYQLNDGVSRAYFDHFGLRRRDGTWKPVAFTVPTSGQIG